MSCSWLRHNWSAKCTVFFVFFFKSKKNKNETRYTCASLLCLTRYIYSSLQKVRRGRPWRYDPVTIRNRFEKLGFPCICVWESQYRRNVSTAITIIRSRPNSDKRLIKHVLVSFVDQLVSSTYQLQIIDVNKLEKQSKIKDVVVDELNLRGFKATNCAKLFKSALTRSFICQASKFFLKFQVFLWSYTGHIIGTLSCRTFNSLQTEGNSDFKDWKRWTKRTRRLQVAQQSWHKT